MTAQPTTTIQSMNYRTFLSRKYKRWGGVACDDLPNVDLEAHDRQHHPDGYKEGDTCKFRAKLSKGDEVDGRVKIEHKQDEPDDSGVYRQAALAMALAKVARTGEARIVRGGKETVSFRTAGTPDPLTEEFDIIAIPVESTKESIGDKKRTGTFGKTKQFTKAIGQKTASEYIKYTPSQKEELERKGFAPTLPKPLFIGGEEVYLWQNGLNHIACSGNSQYLMNHDFDGYLAKMAILEHLPAVFAAAVPFRLDEPEKHQHKQYVSFFKNGFDNYAVLIAARDRKGIVQEYTATIVLNKHENGTRYLYDILLQNKNVAQGTDSSD